jgi:hypothetical protein
MKRTLKVNMDAVKHERDKDGDLLTTLHLELPDNSDLSFLQRAYRIARKNTGRETATFTLRVYGAGDRRTWNVTSKGGKTRDFKVVAVVETYFSVASRFEQYLNPADRSSIDVELDVQIEEPQDTLPLFPKQDDDADEGLSA